MAGLRRHTGYSPRLRRRPSGSRRCYHIRRNAVDCAAGIGGTVFCDAFVGGNYLSLSTYLPISLSLGSRPSGLILTSAGPVPLHVSPRTALPSQFLCLHGGDHHDRRMVGGHLVGTAIHGGLGVWDRKVLAP